MEMRFFKIMCGKNNIGHCSILGRIINHVVLLLMLCVTGCATQGESNKEGTLEISKGDAQLKSIASAKTTDSDAQLKSIASAKTADSDAQLKPIASTKINDSGKGNKDAAIESDELASQNNPVVMPTGQYIPHQILNDEGFPLPYRAMSNPYLTSKRVIEQGSVLLFIKARRAFKIERYAEAVNVLTELTEKDKSLAGPWVMLGKIAMKNNDPNKAIHDFSNALSINADNVNAYIGLAIAQRQKGQFILAQNTYAQALSVWRDFPEAHLNLAIVYDKYLNQPLKAQQHMEAYQFLTKRRNKKVSGWFAEIKDRTRVDKSFITAHQEGRVVLDKAAHESIVDDSY